MGAGSTSPDTGPRDSGVTAGGGSGPGSASDPTGGNIVRAVSNQLNNVALEGWVPKKPSYPYLLT